MSAQVCLLVTFLEAGESPSHFFSLSETARPQIGFWQKIRVNPNYLVVFFTVVTPSHSQHYLHGLLSHEAQYHGSSQPSLQVQQLLGSFDWRHQSQYHIRYQDHQPGISMHPIPLCPPDPFQSDQQTHCLHWKLVKQNGQVQFDQDRCYVHLSLPYIKDKVTMDNSLNHGDDFPKESLSKTDWNDFKEPIIGTLIHNFFVTYFG
jgi:hypothetical protein